MNQQSRNEELLKGFSRNTIDKIYSYIFAGVAHKCSPIRHVSGRLEIIFPNNKSSMIFVYGSMMLSMISEETNVHILIKQT